MRAAATADFVAEQFRVPPTLEHERFRLRMLSAKDAEADYDAVMASQTRLRAGSPHGWPRKGFTLTENLRDLQRHEQEFRDRVAFAYTMTGPGGGPDEHRVLGCVYINPPADRRGACDAEVYMWVRDEFHPELTGTLFKAVDGWLKTAWPFSTVRYIRSEYYLPGNLPAS